MHSREFLRCPEDVYPINIGVNQKGFFTQISVDLAELGFGLK